jgi:thiol-disulfide isomerase/thioredoxin
MKRRGWLMAGAGVAAAAAGVAWQWRTAQQAAGAASSGGASGAPGPVAGQASAAASVDANANAWWTHTLERPDGSALALQTLRGQPLIVNFWATWCPPCVREMPMIERFYQAQRAQAQAAGRPAWRILGLAVDKRAAVAEYLARQPVSYDIAVAGFDAMQWGRDWGNDKNGLPFTVAFAADGRVLARKSGELAEGELERWPLG